MPRAFPIAFEGKTGIGACIPTGPTSCTGAPVGTASENTFLMPEYEGTPTSAELTLTWMATTPATDEMYIFLGTMRSCGEGCFESDSEMYGVFTTGMSPLVLGASDIVVRADETLFVHVGTVDKTPGLPVPFFYGLEQSFAMDGTLTALVNATT